LLKVAHEVVWVEILILCPHPQEFVTCKDIHE
jgi:hypothetical protein